MNTVWLQEGIHRVPATVSNLLSSEAEEAEEGKIPPTGFTTCGEN